MKKLNNILENELPIIEEAEILFPILNFWGEIRFRDSRSSENTRYECTDSMKFMIIIILCTTVVV